MDAAVAKRHGVQDAWSAMVLGAKLKQSEMSGAQKRKLAAAAKAEQSGMPRAAKVKPPHGFVVEALAPLRPEVRRMFSGFAVYIGDLLVLMLRDASKHREDNGIWVVLAKGTDPADAGLRRELPSIRAIGLLGDKIRHWLVIPSDGADFEKEALDVCELILRGDPRVGRIPKSRR